MAEPSEAAAKILNNPSCAERIIQRLIDGKDAEIEKRNAEIERLRLRRTQLKGVIELPRSDKFYLPAPSEFEHSRL